MTNDQAVWLAAEVAAQHGVNVNDFFGKDGHRDRAITVARADLYRHAKRMFMCSNHELETAFGRSRGSVGHLLRRVTP